MKYFVIILLSIFFVYVGYSIKKRQNTSFVAGNNEIFVPKNERKLAGRIGLIIMLIGIETIVFPAVFQLISVVNGIHFAILAVINIALIFICMLIDQLEG